MKRIIFVYLNPTKNTDDVLDITKQFNNLLQRTQGNEVTAFTWDFSVLSANEHPYLLDELGTPIRFNNEIYSYDEFGLSTNSSTQPFSFTGYQHDTVANTLFAQAREYTPNTGRFVAKDLVKGNVIMPSTLNAYLYCVNSPLNLVDLNGLIPVNPEVYGNAMGADDVTTDTNRSGFLWLDVTRTATITYGDETHSFTLNSDGKVDYSEINAAFGWENPWIPNGQTYSAFLGSHPTFNSPWHHSSLVVFALPDCPVFGGHELFAHSFSNVNYMTIGGDATGGLFGQWGRLIGLPNRPSDVNLDIKNEMLPLNVVATVILQMIQNTYNFMNSPHLTYALTPADFSNSYNSGSFLAGLLRSVGITITPGPNSPGWDKPVPRSHFICQE